VQQRVSIGIHGGIIIENKSNGACARTARHGAHTRRMRVMAAAAKVASNQQAATRNRRTSTPAKRLA